jgi:polysaccharide biosynthesis transport protein
VQRYFEILRDRWWLVAAAAALGTLAAILYVVTASRVYEAQSDMLVTPVSGDDPAVVGLGLIRLSADPTRDVETASRLVENADVASRVKRNLGLRESPAAILGKVSVEPVAQSSIITVAAHSEDPAQAQALANGFAKATVQERTQKLHRQLDSAIARLEARLDALSARRDVPTSADDLGAQLATLQTLRSGPDPTLQVETAASRPASPVSPKVMLAVAAGLISGILLGAAGAFAMSGLDSRFRSETQVRSMHDLPILARLPRQSGGVRRVLKNGDGDADERPEAYRALGARLLARATADGTECGRAILVTGPAGSEGTSTTALNLAKSLAVAGHRVILIEADLRRPAMWRIVGQPPRRGLLAALNGSELERCLVGLRSPGIPRSLRFLLPEDPQLWNGDATDRMLGHSASSLLARARELAEVVVIDAPPLAITPGALALAQHADAILVVARLGHTRPDEVDELGDILAGRGLSAAGIALVGAWRGVERGGNGAWSVERGRTLASIRG